MGGTREGGKKAAITNRERHGKDYYKEIGYKGGKSSHTGGFYGKHKFAQEMGRLGAKIKKEKHGKK